LLLCQECIQRLAPGGIVEMGLRDALRVHRDDTRSDRPPSQHDGYLVAR
jgi:hypothetical protein